MTLNKTFWDQLAILYFEEDKCLGNYREEKPILEEVMLKIENSLANNNYKIIKPLGRGGSGIIILIRKGRVGKNYALKVPRPKEDLLLKLIKRESDILIKVKHENIIEIRDVNAVEFSHHNFNSTEYPYFIMDYVEKPKILVEWIKDKLESAESSTELNKLMKMTAKFMLDVFKALKYLHNKEIIHFDIKPSNLLINSKDKLVVSDLGFARKKTNESKKLEVRFTGFYAHPELKKNANQFDKNRTKNEKAPKDFEYIWDIYAAGKTILECLALIDFECPQITYNNEAFSYMHLAACRMLDSRNSSFSEIEKLKEDQLNSDEKPSVFYEEWLGIEGPHFEMINYKNAKEIVFDFEKLVEKDEIIDRIPELNPYLPNRIQIGIEPTAPFTFRVKQIIEHPVFSRLNKVHQLGLTYTIYPTATHTVLEHTIGAFRYCCLFIRFLYNDPYNPLFKQLVDENDIKCTLLASLLHDLGLYPLAIYIREFYEDLKDDFFTLEFLENPSKDKWNHTLKEIIENRSGWDVDLEHVKEIIYPDPKSNDFKIQMLHSIISGPTDVNRIDYQQRDSKNCGVKYGDLINVDRLIRNLTTVPFIEKFNNKSKLRVVIGSYEKAQTAAESLAFGRYLLYQSVYWHHTSRAIQTMLREALSTIKNVKKIEDNRKPKITDSTLGLILSKTMGLYSKEPPAIDNLDILDIIKEHADKNGKVLINLIKQRNFYKRILTIHFTEPDLDNFLGDFRNNHLKKNFQKKLQENIKIKFDKRKNKSLLKNSRYSQQKLNLTSSKLKETGMILCDAPKVKTGIKYKLKLVPEPKRLLHNYSKRFGIGERSSDIHDKVYLKLNQIVAKGRIFCHPDIRDTLMVVLGPNRIEEIVKATIKEFLTH